MIILLVSLSVSVQGGLVLAGLLNTQSSLIELCVLDNVIARKSIIYVNSVRRDNSCNFGNYPKSYAEMTLSSMSIAVTRITDLFVYSNPQ